MRAQPVRMLLAGTNVRMRDRMREAVTALPDTILVGEVVRGERAIVVVEDREPDVLVLDMGIPGTHAIMVTQAALTSRPHLGIVVWITLNERAELPDEKVWWMRHAGVCCCVDDYAGQTEIAQAIVSAAAGQSFLSMRLAQRQALTRREHEILMLLAGGWSGARIARTLKITPSTVRSHSVRIANKLGIVRQDMVAARGRELGLGRDLDETTDLENYYAGYHAQREEFYRALQLWRATRASPSQP